jgi:multicomponent Na+:H+ antiporter subunit B
MDTVIDVLLLAFLAICAVSILRLRDLFAMAMMFGLFSLISAGLFTTMDAPDVAFTEAAVGAGISTILILATLAQTARREQPVPSRSKWLPLAIVWVTGAVLIYGTVDLPAFGDGAAPAHNHVAPYYLQESYGDIGIPNVVASILASYRGYDTLGEVVVVFSAVIGVLALLGLRARPPGIVTGPPRRLDQHAVLKVIAKLVVPVILLFGLYVQFHGEYSPGGGFQAGVIFAAAIILYALVFGLDEARRVITPRLLERLPAIGVLIFGGVGLLTMLLGGNYLAYNALGENPQKAQQTGIIMVEIGVGVTVASVMLLIYFTFAERGRGKKAENGDGAGGSGEGGSGP